MISHCTTFPFRVAAKKIYKHTESETKARIALYALSPILASMSVVSVSLALATTEIVLPALFLASLPFVGIGGLVEEVVEDGAKHNRRHGR